jgi:hypothetical protein
MQTPYDIRNKEELQAFIQSLNFQGDGLNIAVDHNQAGVVIKYIGEQTIQAETAGDSGNTERAIIKSGGNGVYLCNVVNNDGTVSDADTLLVTSRATAYDLTADKRILGGNFPTLTA